MMRRLPLLVAAALLLMSTPAFAYVGPGAGISALGSLFTLIGAVFLGIVGFIWYPIKRLIRWMRRGKPDQRES